MAELETLDPKTDNPELYHKLGVQDVGPGVEDAKLLILRDAAQDELAALIVGKRRPGSGQASFYARKRGEARSWLVAAGSRLMTIASSGHASSSARMASSSRM